MRKIARRITPEKKLYFFWKSWYTTRKSEKEVNPVKHNAGYPFYKLCLGVIRLVYPRTGSVGTENIPCEPCIFVGNHAQIHGPILSQIGFPADALTWCIGQMSNIHEVADYMYRDFWSRKKGAARVFFRLVSYVLAPVAVALFTNTKTIDVYKDSRVMKTFRRSVNALKEGKSLLIFPETYEGYNQVVCQFQKNFVDVARLYYRQTGKAVAFVPVYTAPKLHSQFFGRPVYYDPAAPVDTERERIVRCMQDAITDLAVAQPEHIVIPYPNIPKKEYTKNTDSRPIIPLK